MEQSNINLTTPQLFDNEQTLLDIVHLSIIFIRNKLFHQAPFFPTRCRSIFPLFVGCPLISPHPSHALCVDAIIFFPSAGALRVSDDGIFAVIGATRPKFSDVYRGRPSSPPLPSFSRKREGSFHHGWNSRHFLNIYHLQ